MSVSLTLTEGQIGSLRRLVSRPTPTDETEGVVLSSAEYGVLKQLLEDAQDLRDARIAEGEYSRGEGRSLESYLAKRRARTGAL